MEDEEQVVRETMGHGLLCLREMRENGKSLFFHSTLRILA